MFTAAPKSLFNECGIQFLVNIDFGRKENGFSSFFVKVRAVMRGRDVKTKWHRFYLTRHCKGLSIVTTLDACGLKINHLLGVAESKLSQSNGLGLQIDSSLLRFLHPSSNSR